MTEAEQRLIDVALLMAQELQEFVDDAVVSSGDENSLQATQALLRDWEEAYAACGIYDERPAPAGWRFPPDMPADGQRILHTYLHPAAGESGPITSVYGPNYRRHCFPVVRWVPVPDMEVEP